MGLQEECPQCVEHAELHKGNPGFGPANEPCPPCEDHAKNGCPIDRRKIRWW